MAYTTPTVADFKQRFFRDFPYGTTPDTVMDQDISLALNNTAINFNPGQWSSQIAYTEGWLLLSAHMLVTNLRSSSQGIAGGYTWLENTKAANTISAGYAIPQRILDNPTFAMYTKTSYGAKYLELLLPQLAGQMFCVRGITHA